MPDQIKSKLPASEDRHIAIDGCLIHTRICGVSGDLPSIVLEAGNGSFLQIWDRVARQLTSHTRVFSYERAGVGSSDGSGAGCAEVAARLSALLDSPQVKAQIKRPVILVGHSLGGLYARYFAAVHSRDVAGLVLVDTTPDDMVLPPTLLRISKVLLWSLHLVARSGILQRLLNRGLLGDASQGSGEAQLQAISRAGHIRAVLGELRVLPQTQRDVAAQGPPTGLPVLCVSAGVRPRVVSSSAAPMQRSHDRLAAAGSPPWSRHHHMAAATHMGLLSDPQHAEVLGKMILEFATQISPGKPLPAMPEVSS